MRRRVLPAAVAAEAVAVLLLGFHLAFDGARWRVPHDRQFGRGGALPLTWVGEGRVVRVSADTARYTDDGGTELPLETTQAQTYAELVTGVCA